MSRPLLALVTLLASTLTASAQQGGRSIALILDASGSMNAALASGGTRLEAAKTAVAAFIGKLDPNVRIGYRVYGHQSPTRERNCKDTELMVGFNTVSANRDAILGKTRGIRAQGYTPITYVITLAANDVAREPGEHVVVLVSDGKETCEGDPCAAAKALAAADAKLVIHTIGFNVDAAARFQLQCVASVARGSYVDASGAADLGSKLGELAAKPPETKTEITVQQPRPGKLQVRNPDLAGHKVTEAENGKQVAEIRGVVTTVDLPSGLYNVAFGPTVWKSVEVKGGETTVLDPGVIEIRNMSVTGHKVLDWETGVVVGELRGVKNYLSVLPSTFTVTFGAIGWQHIDVKAGERKVLNPAVIAVNRPESRGHRIHAEDGTLVGTLRGVVSTLAVPPGKYTIEVGGQKVPLDLAQGQRMEINVR